MIPIMGIIDPRMGIRHASNAIGEALYGRTRQAVLRLFFGQPDRRFLQKEVIQRIGLGSGAVQRELGRLSRAELLVRTVEGRQTYFQANPRSPIFEELRGLVRKTFGLTYVLHLSNAHKSALWRCSDLGCHDLFFSFHLMVSVCVLPMV